ncbi:MAG: hypothetical protein LBC74_00330 [Planctomycetaceae bacterium]|jgi:hypothetical protein|nr:hypothetical protein [Planctomycetaceae bacterium]
MDSIIAGAIQQQQEQIMLKTQMTVLQKTRSVERELGEALIGLISSAALKTVPSLDKGVGSSLDVVV